MNVLKNKPELVCRECGIEASTITFYQRHGHFPTKTCFDISTYHRNKCDVCNEEKDVTEVRDFFYPDFSLLKKRKNKDKTR